jgi:hypothetical protein
MVEASLPFHHETKVVLSASVEAAFSHLDDFHKLSAHMEQSSGMMMGSKMSIAMDEHQGRAVGSIVSMSGRVLGLRLALREVVIDRIPPTRKVWRTLNTDLIVIGPYQLGFELSGNGASCTLRVFIDYALPRAGVGRWLGRLFAQIYAKWCTEKMASDAARQFSPR